MTRIRLIDFSWWGSERNVEMVDSENWKNKIKLIFSNSNPGNLPESKSIIKINQYAWDGGAWPGNEYWVNCLKSSGDPAAACCSAIPVLQNPDINERLTEKESIFRYPSQEIQSQPSISEILL